MSLHCLVLRSQLTARGGRAANYAAIWGSTYAGFLNGFPHSSGRKAGRCRRPRVVGHRRAGHWRQAHSARIVAALHGGGRRRNSTASPTNCGRRGAGCDCGNRCSSSRRWAGRRGPCWLHLMPTATPRSACRGDAQEFPAKRARATTSAARPTATRYSAERPYPGVGRPSYSWTWMRGRGPWQCQPKLDPL